MSPPNNRSQNRERPPSENQLVEHLKKYQDEHETITTDAGNPVGYEDASMTVGELGPTLMQDYELMDKLGHFTRERIPERVVHAKGAGAFGYFEVTHDITNYTAAKVFSEIGKKTPIAVRFSTVAGEKGYPDTVRDIRGFAIKFYTEDGIWDLLGNNTPVFFIKDAALFPSCIHVMKRNPVTNCRPDYDMFWDMLSLRPESTHTLLMMFSDRGIPASYRNQHGFGVNTYTFVNADGKYFYVKFHYRTNQGIKNMTPDEAQRQAGIDPDYTTRDLYNAIESRNYPSWNFYVQIMTPEQAENNLYDPFDDTKVWLHKDYPLIPVGKFVLNKNPSNYFAEIEQMSMDVAHLIPGIQPSPDRMLQGRLFAYADTHRYRLGINYSQLPVNSPFKARNYQRDGLATINSQGGAPNYHPNSFGGPEDDPRALSLIPQIPLQGHIKRVDNADDDNFTQSQLLWNNVLKSDEKDRIIENMVDWLRRTTPAIQQRTISNFANVDSGLAEKLKEGVNSSKFYLSF